MEKSSLTREPYEYKNGHSMQYSSDYTQEIIMYTVGNELHTIGIKII